VSNSVVDEARKTSKFDVLWLKFHHVGCFTTSGYGLLLASMTKSGSLDTVSGQARRTDEAS
jgi:hypothetical protein